MRKLFKGLFLLILSIITVFSFTACGGFFGEESIIISSVSVITLENGNTQVTITYENEDKKPDIFEIPKGDKGDKGDEGEIGIGIKEILHEKNANGNVDVIIKYTDETIPDKVFEVERGVSIVSAAPLEEDGKKYMVLTYNNGDTAKFELPEGKPGMGIKDYKVNTNPVNPALTASILFNMDDGTSITIDIPKGEVGRGIESMTAITTETKYVIKVKYTNDSNIYDLEFDRPTEPNRWYYDACEPHFSDKLGKAVVGDYFFDTAHNDIYLYEKEGGWVCIVDYHDDEQTYTITFDLNDNDGGATKAAMPSGSLKSYTVNRSTYFTDNGYSIPVPTRTGYEFVGWSTSRTPSPVDGYFTTLTPIFSDMTLYAIWKQI